MTLDGTVEMDGLYIGGHVRSANREEDRFDRRVHNPRRQCVMVLRQRGAWPILQRRRWRPPHRVRIHIGDS